MATHTPKGAAIEKFIHHEGGDLKNWIIKTVEEPDSPVVMLHARRDDEVEGAGEKLLELHTRQVRLYDDELDEAAKTMIRRWMNSL